MELESTEPASEEDVSDLVTRRFDQAAGSVLWSRPLDSFEVRLEGRRSTASLDVERLSRWAAPAYIQRLSACQSVKSRVRFCRRKPCIDAFDKFGHGPARRRRPGAVERAFVTADPLELPLQFAGKYMPLSRITIGAGNSSLRDTLTTGASKSIAPSENAAGEPCDVRGCGG